MKFKTIGGPYGDQMTDYEVTDYNANTLGEFVEEVLEEFPQEWGYIGVKNKPNDKNFCVFGYPNVEYKYGKLTTPNFTEDYLNKKILKVRCNGGWTKSDYKIEIEENNGEV